MLRKSTLVLAVLSALALQVHAGPEKHAWPLTNAHHRDYFCAARAETENAPPAGYTKAENREFVALSKKGFSAAKAVAELRARARCDELPMEARVDVELAPVGLERR